MLVALSFAARGEWIATSAATPQRSTGDNAKARAILLRAAFEIWHVQAGSHFRVVAEVDRIARSLAAVQSATVVLRSGRRIIRGDREIGLDRALGSVVVHVLFATALDNGRRLIPSLICATDGGGSPTTSPQIGFTTAHKSAR